MRNAADSGSLGAIITSLLLVTLAFIVFIATLIFSNPVRGLAPTAYAIPFMLSASGWIGMKGIARELAREKVWMLWAGAGFGFFFGAVMFGFLLALR